MHIGPADIGVILYLVLIVLGVILSIAWTIVPFAIIGTKPLLRRLIAEVEVTNALLEQQRNALLAQRDLSSESDGWAAVAAKNLRP